MNEDINGRMKSVVMLVDPEFASLASAPEAKNLESIAWYLRDLSARAVANNFANADEFVSAAKNAEKTLSELILVLSHK